MTSKSVVEWLKNLRYSTENYDLCNYMAMNGDKKRNSGPYENIWECTGDFKLHYGNVCRLSVDFCDTVDDFQVVPIVFDYLDLNVSADVAEWRNQLKCTYCEEEENMFESTELIKNLESHHHQEQVGTVSSNKPQHFPVVDDDRVEIRKSPAAPTGRIARSKTIHFEAVHPPSWNNFEIKGVSTIHIGVEMCTKIQRNERLKFTNGEIQILSDKGTKVLWRGVDVRKGTKPVSKKDVEIRDVNGTIYLLQFDNAKDAKHFVDVAEKSNERTITIKTRLLRLLGKRSSRDLLESKGILKNEPIFGNTLANIYEIFQTVPPFLTKIVQLIELPQNIKSVGVYRTSGNLATIQKIRFEVDYGKLEILDVYRNDVDVLTGSLKLFFRELKEPLIPFEVCEKILRVILSSTQKNDDIRKIINELPDANKDILLFLIKHLVKVCEYKNDNKMDVYNLSVCWGPSLIAISDTCTDIVVQTSNNSKVLEYLLNYFQLNSNDFNNLIQWQNSQESIASSQSITNLNINNPIDEVVNKLVELIETNIEISDDIYRKSGSYAKIDKIIKKIEKNKLHELDKYVNNTQELCCALKRYLTTITLTEPLITKQIYDDYCTNCDNSNLVKLKRHIREKINLLPMKQTLIVLMRHFRNIIRTNDDRKMLAATWMPIFIGFHEKSVNDGRFLRFFHLLLSIYDCCSGGGGGGDNNRSDTGFAVDLSKDQIKCRESKYDNLPDIDGHIKGEACILDDKTDL